jgi:hypothetical protein
VACKDFAQHAAVRVATGSGRQQDIVSEEGPPPPQALACAASAWTAMTNASAAASHVLGRRIPRSAMAAHHSGRSSGRQSWVRSETLISPRNSSGGRTRHTACRPSRSDSWRRRR